MLEVQFNARGGESVAVKTSVDWEEIELQELLGMNIATEQAMRDAAGGKILHLHRLAG